MTESNRLSFEDGLRLSMSDEQAELVSTVRRFVREKIVPLESKLDPDADTLPPEDAEPLKEQVRAMGLYNIDAPVEYGGPGLDIVTRVLLAFEMAQHRAGLYTPCYGVFGHGGLAQLYDANDAQKEKYLLPSLRGEKRGFFALTEPAGGSDPARAIETKAVRKGDVWVLNGNKTFISGAVGADFGLVFARTGEKDSGRGGITCFLVDADTPGFHVRRVIQTLRKGSLPTELVFDDVEVPHDNILGDVGGGFKLANSRLSRNRIPYAAGCLGVAIKAHHMAMEYAGIRSVFGKTLAEHEGIQWMFVDSEIDLRGAILLTLHAASMYDAGKPFRTEAAIAKLQASEAAGRVVDRSLQIHGGYGVTADLPLERWYRELRIRRIGEGSSETQRMIISRDLLSKPGTMFL